MAASNGPNRWMIAAAGTLLQLCLGTVYAWSYFQNPICDAYGWSNTQVTWVFSLAICFLGLAAAWGGLNLPRFGPRRLAVAGAVLFGLGYLVGAAALYLKSLPLLYLGYGFIGGTGLGLAYVTPVATVAKWFPDKKGLATGLVIMGFGFGALLMSKLLAPLLTAWAGGDMVTVFAALGVVFLLLAAPVASLIRNPPEPQRPAEHSRRGGFLSAELGDRAQMNVRQGLLSRQFVLMWAIFFCNITAGIAIISFQSPIFQDIWKKTDATLSDAALASLGASLIAVSSIFNGLGRFLWGGLSDRIGPSRTFSIMLATQAAAFILLVFTGNPWICGLLICYVLLCYGGGFGTMPSFVLNAFGARRMAVIYGAILTAWSCGGIVGPQLVAIIKDRYQEQSASYSCLAGAGLLCIGLLLSFFTRNPPTSPAGVTAATAPEEQREPARI